ncbi:unnamed protein product [Paramecium sonneborni]|uniref:Uncharacterized protein n=1 Tax=Paramecium sonneborni TaxID=65129 RepID=A0A8S1R8T6_9CILI|nr:unnamed protein product [Paramecium sonneborni]
MQYIASQGLINIIYILIFQQTLKLNYKIRHMMSVYSMPIKYQKIMHIGFIIYVRQLHKRVLILFSTISNKHSLFTSN